MAVKAIAREPVVRVAADDPIGEVAQTMDEAGVGSVVVVDDGSPVGIITDRDLTIRVLAREQASTGDTAEEVMSSDLVTAGGTEGVLEVIRKMSNNGIRRMPVVEDGELVGIVTVDDLLVLLSMEFQGIGNIIRSESPPYEVSATEVFGE